MFCIFHEKCPKAGDNGHCTVFANTRRYNTGMVRCSLLPTESVAKTPQKKLNPLKASKKGR